MNIYKSGEGIEWTNPPWTVAGASWNPIAGCFHNCEWTMPDGDVATCYAAEIANRFRSDKVYPHGFKHFYWHPERLKEPAKKKEPHGVFIGSMADIWGRWVRPEYIRAVMDVFRDTPQHTYFTLTKDPQGMMILSQICGGLPSNVWAGCSLPDAKERGTKRFLKYLRYMDEIKAPVRWWSFEPLWFDAAAVLREWLESGLQLPCDWIVIGAASKGSKTYQPEPEWVQGVLDVCDEQNIPVFMKDNLDWPERRREWPDNPMMLF